MHTNTVELRTRAAGSGFTLIEIIMVLSIIAILLGAGIYHLIGVPEQGKIARVRSDFSTLRGALNLYQMNGGSYPSTEQGLAALVKKPTTGRAPQSYRPFLRKELRDPWGSPYGYGWPAPNGGDLPDIYSSGKDQVAGTEDDIHMYDDEE